VDFKDLYTESFREHGPTPQGVGWLDGEVQRRRFHILMDGNQYAISSILDVGCGYGELVEFLNKTKRLWFNHVKYTGIDVVPEMIDVARARHSHVALQDQRELLNTRVFHEADVREWSAQHLETYDLVVCSGALSLHGMNEKLEMLDAMWELTGKVLAFNMKGTEAYLRDLNMILPRFKTDNWQVRHDYGLDDMTIMVKR
jgi:SAM-dependent methyltransferase